VDAQSAITTFLFTDIEGSSELWERQPDRMRPALARHDAILRRAVLSYGGTVVKMTGDGVCAAFDDPLDAVRATLAIQLELADPAATAGLALRARSGMHLGVVERRDGDYFGNPINRAARIMSAAHGGQVLLSQAVVDLVDDRLPPEVTLRDLGSLRLRGLASPERIHQVLHPALPQDFPALRSLVSTPHNLPQQVTSFIGRDRELAELKRLLPTTRLLTLLGAGGIGKTRVALHAAAEVMDDYPDGVWFVDLAPQADPHLVSQTVASVLGVKEEPGHSVGEALVNYVRDKRLLLVLDNCEHLLQACADLASQLLRAGGQLRILAASREPLRIAGETNFPVPALAVPDERASATPEVLERYEATRLFVHRARASHPQFEITDRNASAVVDICRRLDGIPLAIELAAARVRTLPVETITGRLSDRFRLLAGGDQTALPRQQTLRALIDWSHDLLTESERVLLRRLSVFAGGWTLEAAERVGSGGDLVEADVLDVLSNLVDKSLVVLDAGGARYRLLETVREYARERLDRSDDARSARLRHLEHFVAFAETARPALYGPDRAPWLARLDLERENLLACHAWTVRTLGIGEAGLKLAYALGPYWFLRGQPGLGLRMSTEAIAHPDAQARTRSRYKALFDAGQHCCFTGRYDEAQAPLEESLAIARELGDNEHVARVLQPLGMAAFGRGDRRAARAHMEEAVKLAREIGDKHELAAALNGLAQLHRVEGELDSAEPLYDQVVELGREVGNPESVAIGLLNLAMVAIGRGSRDRARTILTEVVEIAVDTGSKPLGQSAFDVCAGFAVSLGEPKRAARLFGLAQSQIGETGLQRDPADEGFLMPLIDEACEALGTPAFEAAERGGRDLTYEGGLAELKRWLAGVAVVSRGFG
jgi:predicted ATPase/class 3 adenylate cyclase